MGLINSKRENPPKTNQDSDQDKLDCYVAFRCSSKELKLLKEEAKKTKRNISNLIKFKLFTDEK